MPAPVYRVPNSYSQFPSGPPAWSYADGRRDLRLATHGGGQERREDLPLLIAHLLGRFAEELAKERPGLEPDAERALLAYAYPATSASWRTSSIRRSSSAARVPDRGRRPAARCKA